jgi:hypothetical protein
MRKRYSDGVDQLFVVKGAKRTRFVRKSTETTKGAEAFQAHDAGTKRTRAEPIVRTFNGQRVLLDRVNCTYCIENAGALERIRALNCFLANSVDFRPDSRRRGARASVSRIRRSVRRLGC